MNASAEKKPGFAIQMKNVFALPGQTLKDFMEEFKVLSMTEKKEFAAMLNAAGYPCDEPMESTAEMAPAA